MKIVCLTPAGNDGDHECRFNNNDDALIEILLWLPAKSLTRFKLVCKHWLSLISADYFRRLHTLRHPKPPPSLILRTHNSQFFYLNPIINGEKLLIPYSFGVPNPKLLSSCNGLMLLQSDHPEKGTYYVYNPTTKQSRKISLTNNDKYTNVLGLNLAFDPSKSPHYKIVCVRAAPSDRERTCQIEVYDSESRTWRLSLEPFATSMNADFSSGAHWNNVIHWKSFLHGHLYFDIDKNVTGYLPHALIPWSLGEGGAAVDCGLQESNGNLYHFTIVSQNGDVSVAVYELQEDYSQWYLKYHEHHDEFDRLYCILSFIRGDDGKASILVSHVPGKIKAYRFLDKRFEELVDLSDQPFYHEDFWQFDCRNVYQFGESLASV